MKAPRPLTDAELAEFGLAANAGDFGPEPGEKILRLIAEVLVLRDESARVGAALDEVLRDAGLELED